MATPARRMVLALLVGCMIAYVLPGSARSAGPYRVAVLYYGVLLFDDMVNGLRTGLKEQGLEEGAQYVIVRRVVPRLDAVEEAARLLERARVDVIYSLATSVTLAVKPATTTVPVVFAVGTDPVASGLVKSLAKPEGRFTGVSYLSTVLISKRLELLRLILPRLRSVVTFYDPKNPIALQAIQEAREAGRQLGVTFIERHVNSAQALKAALNAQKPREADAFFYISDAVVASQSALIVAEARAKKLPTMFHAHNVVIGGGLAAYGPNYIEVGRVAARQVARVLNGTRPADIPVENVRTLEFLLNLRTAQELGITIPHAAVQRADRVIR